MDTSRRSERVELSSGFEESVLAGAAGPLSCAESIPVSGHHRSWLVILVDRHVTGPALSFLLHGALFLALMMAVGPLVGPQLPEVYIESTYMPRAEEQPKLIPVPTPVGPMQPRMPTEKMAALAMTATAGAAARKGAVIALSAPSAPIQWNGGGVASLASSAYGSVGAMYDSPFKGGLLERTDQKRIASIAKEQAVWEVTMPAGNIQGIRAKFTVYQAKYHGGDSQPCDDWNCNPTALPNMLLQVRAWSKDRIEATLRPEALDIGTEAIFTIKPPFIYLTGHRDFKLLDNEIKNLRDYLMLGGALWADSALAGRHSRFDAAFRREVARVLPDRDFEPLAKTHPIFTDSFFTKLALPTGMNGYEEEAEIINVGPELAVLYTPNGYGHLWESRLDKAGNIEWARINVGPPGKPRWGHVYGPHLGWGDAGVLYRGINDPSVRNGYRFGINVIVHLLVRYQKHFQFIPKDLPARAEASPAPRRS